MVLLTGATGFIGSHLLPKLSENFRVRCLVRPGAASKIPGHPNVETFEGDLTDAATVRNAMRDVETVVHLAALLRTKKSEDIFRVNVRATRLLAEAAAEAGAKHFIFTSSENALREDLTDAYAETKRRAEHAVRAFPHALVLYPCFVYGPGDRHGLGRLVECIEKSPVVPLFGGLTSRMQPVYIDDMVEVLLRAVRLGIEGNFVVAGPDKIGLNDFIKKVCAARRHRKFFVMLPYPLLRLSAAFGDALGPRFGWGKAQLQNLYFSRTYSIDDTVHTFHVEPRGLEEGLRRWFGAGRRS